MTITINGSGTITGATTLASTIASPAMTTPTLTTPTMTGAVVSSMGSSVITSGTAVASTSGTSIDFTGIPSWAKRITVMFYGVSTNGTSTPQVQIGSGSFLTSGYGAAISIIGSSTVASGIVATGFPFSANHTAAYVLSGQMVLTLVDSATNKWSCAATLAHTGITATVVSGGQQVLSGALDRVRITTVNGTDTFDAGTINILYE